MNKIKTFALAATLCFAGAASAQEKSVAVEHVPAFNAFNHWAGQLGAVPETPVGSVQSVPLTLAGAAAGDTYQPLPVILGLPDLPLVGPGASAAARNWSQQFNYQGLILRQVVLDAAGRKRELRGMGAPLQPGERFKVRVTATFDAVAAVDQVIGDLWYGRRTGQVYPQAGLSVQIKAGETVDLPLGANEYFLMNRPANERLVVSVRHAKASPEGRSDQPAYRQDGRIGSLYLQLVPRGKFPAIEQAVSQAQ
ncbi:hypothetical protein [Roseateles sp. LYH14W]|uniref:Molecular chaperone n=1 Tax=Pelomonas parva TaxID=3299032 RepID=A0ABW7F759_9BURK